MARYIDAERLKMTFASGIRVYDGMYRTEDIFHSIENEPTADVEEVVRCKDCLFCLESYRHEHYCSAMTNANYVNLDHFCSYGKRK